MSVVNLDKLPKRQLANALTIRIDKQQTLEMLEALRRAVGFRATHAQVVEALIERQYNQFKKEGKL